MNWEQIVGQENLKNLLIESIANGRVSHAQLFTGNFGYGVLPLAMAFSKEILKSENPAAAARVEHLNHLDLHFSYPVFKNKKGLASEFQTEFRDFVLLNPYSTPDDWKNVLESENKQLTIYAEEIDDLNARFALKSFEGGSKILIVWQADKMNDAAANKFLKFLEEPPKGTYIILTAENTDDILPTILSRTQVVDVPRIADEDIERFLAENYELSESEIAQIVFQAQGNFSEALKILKNENATAEFQELFIRWVREAFQVKKRPEFLKNIILWGRDIGSWNREKQKSFLMYCTEMFRLAMLENYGNKDLVYRKIEDGNFKWESFSKFIHGSNIGAILDEISEADYHLERNANAKLVWTDLGIKLSRYIHKTA